MAYTPGAFNFGQPTNYNYISTVDVHKPDIASELGRRYGSQLITGLMDSMGRNVPVSAIEYSHYEENRIMPKIKASIAVAGDVGTFTMLSSNSASYDANSPYLDASPVVTTTGYPVQKYDVLLIPASATSGQGNMELMVTAATAGSSTFTAQPVLTGQTIPTIAGGSEIEIIIIGNSHPEGSGQPNSLDTKVTKYTNNLMNVKNRYDITITEKNVQTWIDLKGSDGKVDRRWFLKGEDDCHKRFMNYRELMLLQGQKITNAALVTTLGFDGQQTQITEGFIPSIRTNGVPFTYSSITGMVLPDLDNWILAADKEKASNENLVFNGINVRKQWSDMGLDITKEGGATYAVFNGNKEAALMLDFGTVTRNGYTFHLKKYDAFNDQQTLGAANFTFVDEFMIIPGGNTVDAKTREVVSSFRMRYLQRDDAPADIKHWYRDQAVTNNSRWECNYESIIGFEGFGLNHFGYGTKL